LAFNASASRKAVIGRSISTCALIASAWTPASVRPAAWSVAFSPVIAKTGFLDRLLDARPVRLPLPAHERPPVIFDRQPETRHPSLVPAGTGKPRSSSAGVMAPRPAR
jgi:hypothetical protein